jgi:RimJ/RimL family protein N-acetyltransferase
MDRSAIARVEGPNLRLRLIEPDDAVYVHGLRTDPRYNTHLSAVTGSVEDQRRWIEGYKSREATGQELYYVIERKDGTRCGLVRLYDIEADYFTWGSWILDENKPPKAALESAVLIYEIGFGALGCSRSVFDVRAENENTLAFHKRFGASETGADTRDVFFEYTKETFVNEKADHMRVLTNAEAKAQPTVRQGSVRMIDLPQIHDLRGDLTFVEGGNHLPFEIARVYYLYNVPVDSERGGHAHKELEQVVFALSGSFRMKIDDGTTKSEYWLRDPRKGLYINRLIWREMDSFSQGAVCMVLASHRYDEADYYRDYKDFLRAVRS